MENSLVVQLGMDLSKLEAGLNKSNSLLSGFKNSVEDIGKKIVAAFAVERVSQFAFEITKLSGEAAGVKNAFDKLQNSAQVLEQMKKATQNTVSELSLMKYAVQADNFGIPLSQMASLFEFAHQRAVATGQSVDYLVQSIVTGIGRKSPLILDNLGISAVALKEKMKGVGTETATVGDVAKAVGDIASEAMAKMGGSIETASTKIEQNAAKWENLKVKLGDFLNESGLAGFAIKTLSVSLDILGRNGPNALESLTQEVRIYNQMLKEGKGASFLANQLDLVKKAADKAGYGIYELKEGFLKFEQIKQSFSNGDVDPLTGLPMGGGEAYKGKAKEADVIKNIAFYEAEIKKLRADENIQIGQELSNTQRLIEQEQKKLDLLKMQYALERDRANTAQLGKMKDPNTDIAHAGQLAVPGVSKMEHALGQARTRMNAIMKDIADHAKGMTAGSKDAFDGLAAAADQMGTMLGTIGANILTGQMSVAQGLASITGKIAGEYARQAILAAASKAAQGAPPGPWSIGLAAAAAAAMSGLFAALGGGGSHGSGGGHSGGGSLASQGNRNVGRSGYGITPQMIHITGQIQGRDLVFAYDKNKQLDTQRRGG